MSNSENYYSDSDSGRNCQNCFTCQPLHSMIRHPLGTSAQLITDVIAFLKWLGLRLDVAPPAVRQVTIFLFTLLYMHHHAGRHCSCYVACTQAVQALVLGYSIINHQDACVWLYKLDLFLRKTYVAKLKTCYNAIKTYLFINFTALIYSIHEKNKVN